MPFFLEETLTGGCRERVSIKDRAAEGGNRDWLQRDDSSTARYTLSLSTRTSYTCKMVIDTLFIHDLLIRVSRSSCV